MAKLNSKRFTEVARVSRLTETVSGSPMEIVRVLRSDGVVVEKFRVNGNPWHPFRKVGRSQKPVTDWLEAKRAAGWTGA